MASGEKLTGKKTEEWWRENGSRTSGTALHCTALHWTALFVQYLKYEQQLHEGEEGSEHYGPEVNVPPDSLRETHNTRHTA
jgi:uncharacterized protein YukJ